MAFHDIESSLKVDLLKKSRAIPQRGFVDVESIPMLATLQETDNERLLAFQKRSILQAASLSPPKHQQSSGNLLVRASSPVASSHNPAASSESHPP